MTVNYIITKFEYDIFIFITEIIKSRQTAVRSIKIFTEYLSFGGFIIIIQSNLMKKIYF